MRSLFDLFLDISLFRKGPQDVPASLVLLKLCAMAYAATGLLALLVGAGAASPFRALILTLADIGLLAGLTYGVLNVLGHGIRFVQTLTALTGVGTLLQLIALPLALWLHRTSTARGVAELPALLWFVLLVWSIAITAHILRHAFSVSTGIGVLYALGYLAISWTVADWLLPQPG